MCGPSRVIVQLSIWLQILVATTAPSETNDLLSSSCPSFCDANNYYHKAKPCPPRRFCCRLKEAYFDCCTNSSLRLKDHIKNDYNCYGNKVLEWLAAYWKIVLAVCLPVGTFSVIAAVTLCSLQNIRQRRFQRQQSAMAELERTSKRAKRQLFNNKTKDMTIIDIFAHEVCLRSNSAASTVSGATVSSLGLPSPCVVVTSEENALQRDIVHIELQTLQPPPYTDAKPPQYADVYP
ncbi:hypothetical protein LSH36_7g02008 [Paralvinella palmiformis]|uniref:Uncharacterized protein n=1 Tax=Paralvinella palmiformis TaxID=53620 RepID=A0AAD9KEJ4_9ANNE|nr:hypothetical protein LSH36_7g02008 [Paralvinella palmiformis]